MYNGSDTSKKFKVLPMVFTIIGCLLFLFIICIGMIPSLISTEWGKKRLFSYLKKKYDVEVTCQQLSLQWFSSVEITDLVVCQDKNKIAFDCAIIKTESSLFSLIARHDFGHLYFDRPHLKMSPSFVSFLSSTSHFPKIKQVQTCSLGVVPIHEPLHFFVPYKGIINCTYGKVEIAADNLSPILFDAIMMNIETTPKEHSLFLHLTCQTLQNGTQGNIEAEGTFTHMGSSNPTLKMQSTLSHLPVNGVDQILTLFEPKYKGLLVNAIGETADLKLDAVSTLHNFDIDFALESSLSHAQLSLKTTDDGKATLKQPATFALKVTPECFQILKQLVPNLSAFSLKQEGAFEGSLKQFTCMIPQSPKDILQASFDGSVKAVSALNFQLNDTPLILNHLEWTARNDAIAGSIRFNGITTLSTQDQSTECTFEGLIDPLSHNGLFSFDVQALPIEIAMKLSGSTLPLSSLMGSTLSLKASGTIGLENRLRIQLDSPLLQLQEGVFAITDRFTLLGPMSFKLTLQPEVFQTNLFTLSHPTLFQGSINALSVSTSNLEDLKFDVTATSDAIDFMAKGPLSLCHFETRMNVASLEEISISLSCDRLHAHASAKYQEKSKELFFLEPVQCDLTVDDEVLHAIYDTPLSITEPAQLKVIIDPFTLSIPSPLNSTCKGKSTLPQLIFLPFKDSPQIILKNLEVPFAWNGHAKTAAFNLTASIEQKGQSTGSLSLKSTFEHVQLDKLESVTANALIEIQELPTSFPDAFLQQPLCSSLLGPHFSTTLKIQSTAQMQNLGLTLNSPLVSIKSTFNIKEQTLSLSGNPTQVQWTLSPAGYCILDQMLAPQAKQSLTFDLKESTTFKLNINKLSLPLESLPPSNEGNRIPIHFDLNALQCVATGTNPSILFFDNNSHELIQLSALDVSFNKSLKEEPLQLSLNVKVSSQNSAINTSSKSGSLALNASIENLFQKEQIDFSNLSSQISLQMKQFPSRAFDIAARFKGRTDFPFSKIFGDAINASLQATIKNLNGPVTFNVNSPHARFSLEGSLQNGALLLAQPVYAQMKITPEISKLFLKEVNPLSISYFYSEAPVTLEIPARGFYLPLFPSSLSKIAVPSARIELGKIACRNEGNINIALNILKSKQFDKNKELLLWFAPIDLKVKEGVLNLERTEILLADTFDIALWGKVLFVNDKVDMVLGLTAQTLYQAFGIKNLPKDYVLTIPMKGKMDNVQINTTKATTKIALLLASQQKALSDALGKSPAGQFFGGVLQQMALPDNGDVPPAKHPFPWERSKSSYQETSNDSQKKRHFKQNEKPLKQIIKILK